jgi:nitric oxide reductase large subunit
MAGVAASLYRVTRQIWLPLIAAIVCGRVVWFALTWLAAGWFELPPTIASLASLVQGLPGVALQLAVIPLVVRTLARRRSILFPHAHESEAPILQ